MTSSWGPPTHLDATTVALGRRSTKMVALWWKPIREVLIVPAICARARVRAISPAPDGHRHTEVIMAMDDGEQRTYATCNDPSRAPRMVWAKPMTHPRPPPSLSLQPRQPVVCGTCTPPPPPAPPALHTHTHTRRLALHVMTHPDLAVPPLQRSQRQVGGARQFSQPPAPPSAGRKGRAGGAGGEGVG